MPALTFGNEFHSEQAHFPSSTRQFGLVSDLHLVVFFFFTLLLFPPFYDMVVAAARSFKSHAPTIRHRAYGT